MTDKNELKTQLAAVNREDEQACYDAIQLACEKFGCTLVAVPGITQDGRIGAQIAVRKAE